VWPGGGEGCEQRVKKGIKKYCHTIRVQNGSQTMTQDCCPVLYKGLIFRILLIQGTLRGRRKLYFLFVTNLPMANLNNQVAKDWSLDGSIYHLDLTFIAGIKVMKVNRNAIILDIPQGFKAKSKVRQTKCTKVLEVWILQKPW
jgi:hypothetical protein